MRRLQLDNTSLYLHQPVQEMSLWLTLPILKALEKFEDWENLYTIFRGTQILFNEVASRKIHFYLADHILEYRMPNAEMLMVSRIPINKLHENIV